MQTTRTAGEIKDEYVSDVLLKVNSADVVEAVEKKLVSLAPDIEGFDSAGMDTDKAVEAIEQLKQSVQKYATEGVNVSEAVAAILQETSHTASTAKWIAGTAIAAILAVATVVVIINIAYHICTGS